MRSQLTITACIQSSNAFSFFRTSDLTTQEFGLITIIFLKRKYTDCKYSLDLHNEVKFGFNDILGAPPHTHTINFHKYEYMSITPVYPH